MLLPESPKPGRRPASVWSVASEGSGSAEFTRAIRTWGSNGPPELRSDKLGTPGGPHVPVFAAVLPEAAGRDPGGLCRRPRWNLRRDSRNPDSRGGQ